jgi:hypothetical protein
VLLALALVVVAPLAAVGAEQESYYLGPEGVPIGSLLLNPLGGEMPNYDKGRDVKPGLLLERSELGLNEEDEAKFQHWQIEASGERLTGYPTLRIWGAADRFESGKLGVFSAFLLDCNSAGTDCDEISSGEATIDSGRGATWTEAVVDFPEVDHRFEERRHLGVRIVVSAESETDLMFAYGYTAHRSRLTVYAEAPSRPIETSVAVATVPVEDVVVEPTPPPRDQAGLQGLQPPIAAVSVWPWVLTLLVSTAALVALGALLMSSLTRPGRHERLPGGQHVAAVGRTGLRTVRAR